MDNIDYEKAYKEALNRAKLLKDHPEKVVTKNHTSIHASDYIFPELRESEDERVKRILHSISSKMSFHLHDIFTEEEFQCYDTWSNTWLQSKQYEQNTTDNDFIKSLKNIK